MHLKRCRSAFQFLAVKFLPSILAWHGQEREGGKLLRFYRFSDCSTWKKQLMLLLRNSLKIVEVTPQTVDNLIYQQRRSDNLLRIAAGLDKERSLCIWNIYAMLQLFCKVARMVSCRHLYGHCRRPHPLPLPENRSPAETFVPPLPISAPGVLYMGQPSFWCPVVRF